MQSAWQKEIQKDYDDRKASLIWSLTDGNDIEKGIASELSYVDSDLKFVFKKGNEIKEKLNVEKTKLAIRLAESNIKLKSLKSTVGIDPIGDKEGDIQRYDYKQMYPSDTVNEVSGEVQQNIVDKSSQEQMRDYNNCIYHYNNSKRELKIIDTLLNSINDKKEYKLPIKIATELGF